ncbi:2Fe-2S iron-sulfur cluster-binding protein [Clostridium sp. DL1XJH146]
MIISLRSISYEDLKNKLSKEDKIVMLSCNTCVVACGVGGTAMMTTLENMLTADGYNVIGKDLISIACTLNLVEKHVKDIKKKEMYDEATVIIPLVCENSLVGIEHIFKDKKVIPMNKTVGTGNLTMDRGVVLTNPLETTGLEKNAEGYELYEVAEKLNLYDEFFDEDDAPYLEREYVNIKINGEEVTAEKGANLLNVCEENGFFVPHLCYDEELSEAGVCRLCLVKIKGRRDLMPSCCTHVEEGMEIVTEDEELINDRKVILELVMASHNHNCLTCSKGIPNLMGSCELQSLMRRYGIEESRYDENKEVTAIDKSSPVIAYDANRCILCGRCVRACEEIAGLCNIGFVNRGSETLVAAGLNVDMDQSDCAACMACVNVCPTGALTERVIRFSGENWEESKVYSDSFE